MIGIDNGVTGNICFMKEDGSFYFEEIPTLKEPCQFYNGSITKINKFLLIKILRRYLAGYTDYAVVERPMINPGRFKQTLSAVVAYETVIECLSLCGVSHLTIPSSEWHKKYFSGTKKGEIKSTSTLYLRSLVETRAVKCGMNDRLLRSFLDDHDADSYWLAKFAYDKFLSLNSEAAENVYNNAKSYYKHYSKEYKNHFEYMDEAVFKEKKVENKETHLSFDIGRSINGLGIVRGEHIEEVYQYGLTQTEQEHINDQCALASDIVVSPNGSHCSRQDECNVNMSNRGRFSTTCALCRYLI